MKNKQTRAIGQGAMLLAVILSTGAASAATTYSHHTVSPHGVREIVK